MNSNTVIVRNIKNNNYTMQNLQCVVVGDCGVGKTCILSSYCSFAFAHEYLPTIVDNYACNLIINHEPVHLVLHDTTGEEDFKNVRLLCYTGKDVCLICFSVIDEVSFYNVESKWIPEWKIFCPNALVVLVGTKIDMRCSYEIQNKKILTYQDGLRIKNKYNLESYIECSALSNNNIHYLIHSTIAACLRTKTPKLCSIL